MSREAYAIQDAVDVLRNAMGTRNELAARAFLAFVVNRVKQGWCDCDECRRERSAMSS